MNTKQFEFDVVVEHLFKQGKPALDQYGRCAYRGEGGTMCAVGCRIPDDMYNPSMEGMISMELFNKYSLPAELFQYISMFGKLQTVHDGFTKQHSISNWNAWLNFELPSVAQEEGLVYNER